MEAINTITADWANSLREGQLTLCTNSLYDSLMFSTKLILVDFLVFLIYTLFRANNPALTWVKVELEAMFVTFCRGRNTSLHGRQESNPH